MNPNRDRCTVQDIRKFCLNLYGFCRIGECFDDPKCFCLDEILYSWRGSKLNLVDSCPGSMKK